jgi:hypothetical protein
MPRIVCESWERRRALSGGSAVILLSLGALLAGSPARAATVDFESALPGSDVAALGAPGVDVAGGLVFDEALVIATLGYPAAGTWNTTPGGAQGVLNSLDGVITLTFAVPVTSLSVDILALPDAAGDPGSVLLLGTDGGFGVEASSDPASIGDSGLPEATLAITGAAISFAILCPHDLANPGHCLDPSEPTTFWIDQLRFEPIPEPATAVLLAVMLGGLAAHRRTR